MLRILPLVIVSFFTFANLPAHANTGMREAEIISLVNTELDGTGWAAASIEILSTHQMERDEERLIAQEFVATARTMEPLYVQAERTDEYLFLATIAQPGHRFDIEGEAVTYTTPDEVDQSVRLFELYVLTQEGRPLAFYDGSDRTVVIEGTPEAQSARAVINQARAEAQAAAQAEAERLNALYGGEWISLSRCGNIDFEYQFSLAPADERGSFIGEASFRPIYPSPPFELGSYTLNARIDTRQNRLVIDHENWVERPNGLRAISIPLTATGGEDGEPVELTGESANMVGAMSGGTCSFRLQRPETFHAEREETIAPVRALIARMAKGVWIDGSQTGPERDGRTDWPVRVKVSEITENYILATAELQAFHANSQRVLNVVEYNFAVFLTRGIDDARIEWASRPMASGGDMRNLYTRSNRCPALRVTLDAETGVLTGSNNDRAGCIDALRLPLVP